MGNLFGIKRPAERAADAAVAMQGQLQVGLNDMKAQIAETKNELVSKLIPQVNRTLDVAIDTMQAMVVVVKNLDETVSRTTQQVVSLIRKTQEKFIGTLEKVDDTIITVKFSLEIFMIILFMCVVMLCGYELNKLNHMLGPNAYRRIEKDLLLMLRLACICSGIVLVGRIFYIFILQQTEARPIEIALLALIPIFAVLGYEILCLLVFLLRHIFSFLRFALWAPFIIIVSPVFYIIHLTFIAPFIWLYRVYQARLRLRNQYGIIVMHSLVIIIPLFFLKVIDLITFITSDRSSHHPVVCALLATYALFYLVTLVIKQFYPVPPPHQQVRQIYALRYPQWQQRRF